MSNPLDASARSTWNSPRDKTGVDSLMQIIFSISSPLRNEVSSRYTRNMVECTYRGETNKKSHASYTWDGVCLIGTKPGAVRMVRSDYSKQEEFTRSPEGPRRPNINLSFKPCREGFLTLELEGRRRRRRSRRRRRRKGWRRRRRRRSLLHIKQRNASRACRAESAFSCFSRLRQPGGDLAFYSSERRIPKSRNFKGQSRYSLGGEPYIGALERPQAREGKGLQFEHFPTSSATVRLELYRMKTR
ncbi:unnamed protein product, partial [Nesidiocoris tenuis]